MSETTVEVTTMLSREGHRSTHNVAPDVYYLPVRGCNVYYIGTASRWVLIDAAWKNCADAIQQAARSLFGAQARPEAILITHAHPDHIGSAAELSRLWRSPVYAHRDELPYLQAGPLPDDLLDPIGRVFQPVARRLPGRATEQVTASPLAGLVQALPAPPVAPPGLPDWECIHTPGHSAGHVVFFRRSDRVLIAGDSVVTAYLSGLIPQVQKLSLPPRPVSWNWQRTKAAVTTVARLEPLVLATGHGTPMEGANVAGDLARFAAGLT